MGDRQEQAEKPISLAEAIKTLRDELLAAREAGAGSDIRLPVQSMTVQLQIAAIRKADGRAGFSVPVVNLEVGGSAGWQRETMQMVTVTFGGPINRFGESIDVAQESNELKR